MYNTIRVGLRSVTSDHAAPLFPAPVRDRHQQSRLENPRSMIAAVDARVVGVLAIWLIPAIKYFMYFTYPDRLALGLTLMVLW